MMDLLTSFGRAGAAGTLVGVAVNWLVEPTTNGGWWLILVTCILTTVMLNALVQGAAAAWPRLKKAGGQCPGWLGRLMRSIRGRKVS